MLSPKGQRCDQNPTEYLLEVVWAESNVVVLVFGDSNLTWFLGSLWWSSNGNSQDSGENNDEFHLEFGLVCLLFVKESTRTNDTDAFAAPDFYTKFSIINWRHSANSQILTIKFSNCPNEKKTNYVHMPDWMDKPAYHQNWPTSQSAHDLVLGKLVSFSK